MRRYFLFASLVFCQFSFAQRLPSFPTKDLEQFPIDVNLNDRPSTYTISYKNYDKAKSKLVKDELSIQVDLSLDQHRKITFYVNDEAFLFYEFDQYGRIIRQKRANNPLVETIYAYDEETLRATETNLRLNGQVHSKVIVEYNADLLPIKKSEFHGQQSLKHYWSYAYDDKGELTEEVYYTNEDELSSQKQFFNQYEPESPDDKEVAIYQDQHLLQRTYYNSYPDSTIERTIIYEQDGSPAELRFELISDSLRVNIKGYYEQNDSTKFRSRFREIFIYDDLIEYESRTISGTKVNRFATFYSYDTHKNWIKKITYQNGIAIREEIRKITY